LTVDAMSVVTIEVDAAGDPGVVGDPGGELAVDDTELAEQTLERVDVAGRDGGLGNVALGRATRHANRTGRQRVVRAGVDVDGDLATPFAESDDERDVRARGNS